MSDETAGETEKERLERNYGDLLQELRVAQAGVQILFAFLLTLPFAARWSGVDTFERVVYLVSLVAAAFAAAMIIAPVAYHRAVFRLGRKRDIVDNAHWFAVGGLAFLFVSMAGAVLLVTDVVVGRAPAIVISLVVALVFVTLWGVLPLTARYAERHPRPHPRVK